ncbi:MAG TPA: hypothetical protein VF316_16660, partial [Polyangiaceae bacterium]
MKLVTYRTDGHDRGGILLGGDVILDLERAFAWWEHRNGRHCDEIHLRERYGNGVLGFVKRADEARPVADEVC